MFDFTDIASRTPTGNNFTSTALGCGSLQDNLTEGFVLQAFLSLTVNESAYVCVAKAHMFVSSDNKT
jgi:hypothetical protein